MPTTKMPVLGTEFHFLLSESLSSLHYLGVYKIPTHGHGNPYNLVSDQGTHVIAKEVWVWGHDNGLHFCITYYTIQKQLEYWKGGMLT